MRFKNIHVIYFSPTHTSARIAHALVEGMGITAYHETDLTYRTPDAEEHIDDELAIIAVPVYAGRVPAVALERLRYFKGNNTPAVAVVLYGNRDFDDALLELTDTLTAQGFIPFAAGAFIGEHSFSRPEFPVAEGRPDEADLAAAMHFGEEALAKLNAVTTFEDLSVPTVRGNRPYKAPRAAQAQSPAWDASLCTFCETCTEVCPVDAIRLEGDEIRSDAERCLKCCACVKECPTGALTFDTPFSAMLAKNCAARKEPEVFL